ncbi:MAG: hypothetical protein ACFHWX_11285 [Bacteroidota bacterium]
MKLPLTILSLLCILEISYGQPMDSIAFGKARLQGGKYELNRFGISKIKLKKGGPSPATDDGIRKDEKIIEGLFTFFTGWSTSSSSETLWHVNNSVKFTGIGKELYFPVLVRGYYEKTRERVNNDDGSHSMESTEMHHLYWDEGADGIIQVTGNKLGDFSVKTRMLANDSIEFWKRNIDRQNPSWLDKKLNKYSSYEEPDDFLVNILFEDQYYSLVYNGDYFQCALIHNQEIIGLWQDAPAYTIVSNKNRINPYLLLQKNITDTEAQRNITLLSMGITLSRHLD